MNPFALLTGLRDKLLLVLIWWAAGGGGAGTAAEVRIRLRSGFVEPADVVVRKGDVITWVEERGSAGSVEGFQGEFESPVLVGSSSAPAFSRQYNVIGMHAFRNWRRNTMPPYGKVGEWVLSHGTIEVRETDTLTTVSLVTPVPGSVFGALPTNYIGSTFPRVVLQAAVVNSNAISKVDFFANGTLIGSAVSWPYEVEWIANAFGDVTLTVTAVDSSGSVAASLPTQIHVRETESPILYPPRVIRPGFVVFDYSVPPPGQWIMLSRPTVESLGIAFDPVKIIQGNWGRFVTESADSTGFFAMRPKN